MPRNGSGSYSLPAGNPFIPSTVISSTTMNNTMSDIGTALTQSLSNDGQTTPVANLPMATFRHTNVGNAQARTDYAAAGQVQDSSLQWLTSVSGADTITASLTPSPGAYTAGQKFHFTAAGTNTTVVTLNINGLGPKAITKSGTVPLSAGDIPTGAVVVVVYDGTQFQLLSAATSSSVAHGQCRLSVSSATTLLLSRYNGSGLIINGVSQNIPSAGVTYTISGLAASTVYRVYAFMNSGTMTLELSTTAHATGTNGVEIKSGDATRTLVGMVATNGSTQFVDSATAGRLCINWFNRTPRALQSANTTNSTTSTSPVSLIAVIPFLTWATEVVQFNVSGYMSNASSGQFARINLYVDAAQTGPDAVNTSDSAGSAGGISIDYQADYSEGQHSFNIFGFSGSGGNCTFNFAIGGTIQG